MNKISSNQKQTEDTFSYKWKKRSTYESPAMLKKIKKWYLKKYFDGNINNLETILQTDNKNGRKFILDAGCGSGMSGLLIFKDYLKDHNYLGIDISDSITTAKKRFDENDVVGEFVKCDLNAIPEKYGNFDIIYSEGVMHHTDSVENSIKYLSSRIKKNGKFIFYVYSKKAPIREFSDDFIRHSIKNLSNEEAWNNLYSITKLGNKLGELNIDIEIDEDIPILGIKKGKHNLQRLFYYKFLKSFYSHELSLDEMNHINFDWFRPLNCFRHTSSEIKEFCLKSSLKIDRVYEDESGISIIATRK
ncbi:methyltransferase domain-containing protein [Candidatus Pelagibacter sp.]|nr:methyltransferase domain-containing protein [Candidatus Pelagibacter sp.]